MRGACGIFNAAAALRGGTTTKENAMDINTPGLLAKLATVILNAVAIAGGAWLLLAVFAAGFAFY